MTAKLHPELKGSVRTIGGVKYIHHPLAIMPLHFVEEMGVDQVNETHEKLKRMIRQAKAEGDWNRYLIHHQRPYRLQAFQDFCFELAPEEFWKHLKFLGRMLRAILSTSKLGGCCSPCTRSIDIE